MGPHGDAKGKSLTGAIRDPAQSLTGSAPVGAADVMMKEGSATDGPAEPGPKNKAGIEKEAKKQNEGVGDHVRVKTRA